MTDLPDTAATPRQGLAHALRAIRRARQMQVREVAGAMGLAQRTYAHFEAGRRDLSVERLADFARVTDSDFTALLLCAGGLNPLLALDCADNKALSIAVDAVADLHDRLSAAFPDLTGADLVGAFEEARRRLQSAALETSRARLRRDAPPGAPLTTRQLECLRWAQAGKSSSDIGVILQISPRTVDGHLAAVCAHFEVRTRIQAIALAIDAGLLSPRTP